MIHGLPSDFWFSSYRDCRRYDADFVSNGRVRFEGPFNINNQVQETKIWSINVPLSPIN
ncbi:MAG: hypothetical protein O4805_16830 [Trichodesmium sp. St16_bin2-tuft]|nr:hypothetical protein [Trichodesmium sp. St16_bin2-tuft]